MKAPSSNFVFSQIPSVVRPRSKFNRDRYYKSTFNAGLLIPIFLDEVLPGDTFSVSTTSFARLSTLITPFMDNLYLDFFFFFVPNRLVWDNWQRFCGEQDNPEDSTDFLVPQINSSISSLSLGDYFGLPVIGRDISFSALPFRAYNLIWNEFFRDENLQNSLTVPKDDGPDNINLYKLRYRGKRKSNQFTSALPWPQKGPGVELPIGGTAPVIGNGNALGVSFSSSSLRYLAGNGSAFVVANNSTPPVLPASTSATAAPSNNVFYGVSTDPEKSGLIADLSSATAVTINSMREAFQVQKWYEQLARGGSRYRELLLSMFGVNTGDARLQRPEYLGGGSTPIQVHSVVQASATDSVAPQGNLAGYGIAGANGIGFQKSFVEHGHVIGLVSVRGDYGFQQGIDRMWSRRTKFDFYWPAFAHLGEVPVLNKEIYVQPSAADASLDDQAFGYQERWYEYRYANNHITGKLRSGITGSLDIWHLAQYFANTPTLNSTFIEENPPVNRVLAVQTEPQFIFDSVIRCRCSRVMPVYSTPGLVDHF